MIISKNQVVASLAFFGPFTFCFYIVLGGVGSLYPSQKLIAFEFGVTECLLLLNVFLIACVASSISWRPSQQDKIPLRNYTRDYRVGTVDLLILLIVSVLHIHLNFASSLSIRHLDEGISSVGPAAYIYYLMKPVLGLILVKFIRPQGGYITVLAVVVCVSFFLLPSAALDVYFLIALLVFLRSRGMRRVNMFSIAVLGILVVFMVVYAGLSVKNSVSDLAETAIFAELTYRAGVYPAALSYYIHNFFSVSAIQLIEMYNAINEYRSFRILGFSVEKLSIESFNRFNFLNTNLWDSSNQPGASPGLWASFFASPLLFMPCIVIYALTIRFLHAVFSGSFNKSWPTLISVSTPLFFSILVSPFDFLYMLGGGWMFIIYLWGQKLRFRTIRLTIGGR